LRTNGIHANLSSDFVLRKFAGENESNNMKKLLVANWKLNPQTLNEAKKLFKEVSNFKIHDPRFELVICPPFVFLSDIRNLTSEIRLGAQDVFWEHKGAYTGEVSAEMLENLGVEYVIIGHSERRKWLKETDEMINKKVLAALGAGLKVILCVGEPLTIRKRGLTAAKKYVGAQLKKDLKKIPKSQTPRLVVAYEPIWAIGTGKHDNPSGTVEMTKFIKHVSCIMYHVSGMRVLYGGSVNSGNAEMFLEKKEIDGALIGGASVKPKEFGKIIKIAQRLS